MIIYRVKENELKQHFLTKVDTVTNVKIPTKPFTNLAYGFAFVELTNSTDFEVKAIYYTFYYNLLNVLISCYFCTFNRKDSR